MKIDDLTFKYVFDEPNPGFINFFAQYGSHFADPKHFLERYHPAYQAREELEDYVEDEGFISWMALMVALRGWSNERAVEVPTLRALSREAAFAHHDASGTQSLLLQGGSRRQSTAVHRRRRRRDHPGQLRARHPPWPPPASWTSPPSRCARKTSRC